MPGDKASSRDSAVIDDDLVEALGFEPLTTDADSADAESLVVGATSDDDIEIIADEADDSAAEVTSKEPPTDDRSSVVVLGDVVPVDADDPVAGDIASAILGVDDDIDDRQDSSEEAETDEAVVDSRSESSEISLDEADLNQAAIVEAASQVAGVAESDEAESDELDGGEHVAIEDHQPASEGDLVVDADVALSAFPDVPSIGDQDNAGGENGELFTQPIDLHDDSASIASEDLALGLDEETETDGAAVEVAPDLDSEADTEAAAVSQVSTGYRRKRVRAKKSRRVVRHIDPWSVLTFSVLFHLALYTAFLLASVLVWQTLDQSGVVDNLEDFIIALGDYETYEINADVLFRVAVVVTGILTVASTIMSVLLCVVFNLISDLVGGIRVTVLEEETVRMPPRQKTLKSK